MLALLVLAACGLVCVSTVAQARQPEDVPSPLPVVRNEFTLAQAAQMAMANSPTLVEARARIEQARGHAIQVGLYPNPQQNSGNPNQFGGANSLYSVGLSQEFVRGGKLRLNREAAMQGVTQSELDFIKRRFELLTNVRLQFIALMAAEQRIAVLRNLQKVAERSENTAVRLKQAEQGTEADVLLLRVELRRVEVGLRSAEFNREAVSKQLAATMGLPYLRIDNAVGTLSPKLPEFDDPQELERLLLSSSLVETARREIVKNQVLLRRAQVEPTPNLTLQTGYQYTPSQPNSQALAGLYFTIPIFDRNQGNIRSASASVRESVAQLSTVENDLMRQLAEAMGRYRTAQRTVQIYEQGILPDARKTLELVQALYSAGQVDLLKILQTQRSVVEANLDYIIALQSRFSEAATIAGLLQLDEFP